MRVEERTNDGLVLVASGDEVEAVLPATKAIRSPATRNDQDLDLGCIDFREELSGLGPVVVLGVVVVAVLVASNFYVKSGLLKAQTGVVDLKVFVAFIDQYNSEGFSGLHLQ